ncbi:MAG: hypothetical protein H7318_13005 [Oligoflexus sp.]|nr:hypothetical protein [Oligoflexus sp.]
MRVIFILTFCLGVVACQHDPWALNATPKSLAPTPERLIPTCLTFLADLNAMTAKELKAENDRRLKLSAEKKGDDDVRAALVAGLYQAKSKNYAKAVELLSLIGYRKNIDEGCRLSIHLYSDVLADLVQLDRDLAMEKKQKGELERKLKALSDIEKDISQRDSKGRNL